MNMRNRLKISIPLTALAVILVSLSSPLQMFDALDRSADEGADTIQ